MKNILYPAILIAILFISCDESGDFSGSGGSNDSGRMPTTPGGKGGSMARFALGTNHLYVVDGNSIGVYKTKTNGSLEKVNDVQVGFGVETIFARGTNLFLGANDAMYIYDITDQSLPTFVSRYDHILSCDPVVVQGNYAYVTLRIGNCRTMGTDAMEIINISDLSAPSLVQSYQVETPYGIGIDGNTLFLCQGDHGVNIYDVANPNDLKLIKKYPNVHAFDVIPNDGVFIMTGDDGIFQYDYSNPLDIKLLSQIVVQ